MARPRKELPPSKEKQVSIRMTGELYEVLRTDAENAHMSLTEYIRTLITDRNPVIHQEVVLDIEGILKPLGNLGKVGSNLNQIARYLNQGGTQTEGIYKEIMNCISEIYEMRDDIKKLTGNS